MKKQGESQNAAYLALLDEKQGMDKDAVKVEAMKSQVSNQSQAYKDLLDECASLKSQLQDFDFMYGDTKKKNE